MTDKDREDLSNMIGDVNAYFSIDSSVLARLDAIRSSINSNLQNAYKNHVVDYKGATTGQGGGESKEIPPPKGARKVRQGGVDYIWDGAAGEYKPQGGN